MLQESDIIPYHLSHPPGERIVFLASHPDDETLGCGGTIRLLIESKKQVKVIFLTSGDKADSSHPASKITHRGLDITEYAFLREKEAEKALRVLGLSDYEFLRFPDRGLHENYKAVLERLLRIIKGYSPDTIYSPSIVELNPDHRATASLSMEIQRLSVQGSASGENLSPIRIVFYEISIPLRPNILVNITSVYSRKKSAIRKYKSQLKLIDYLRHITALNTIRTLTVNGTGYVEAFWVIEMPLSDEDITKWLSYQSPIS